jgi:hypothetical protein
MNSRDTCLLPVWLLLPLGLAMSAPAMAQEAAPGELELDPEAAERALERTLVLRGQLLLPPGQVEVDPSLQYVYSDLDLELVVDDEGQLEIVRGQRDQLTAAFDFRFGMPRDSQLELRVPLMYDRFDRVFGSDDSASGFGDIRVGFAKTLARESGVMPDIVGRIAWDTRSGSDSDPRTLTTGFDEFIGSLSAVRRLDPLVLTGGIFYETSIERDGVDPGDVFGFNVGTTLAASPTTALSFGFNADFEQKTEENNRTINGSDENRAFITFGISSVVRRNGLLAISFGAGLTEDSPDYFIAASLPFRFNAW